MFLYGYCILHTYESVLLLTLYGVYQMYRSGLLTHVMPCEHVTDLVWRSYEHSGMSCRNSVQSILPSHNLSLCISF